MTRPDVTLMVCTRDRAASLMRTLASVAAAAGAAPDVTLEVVVVDNGSRDGSAARAADWAGAQAFAVRVVDEGRAGLSHARNAALAVARGRILAMTDDDCVLHRDYLVRLVAVFAGVRGPAIVGGRILPGDPADLPLTVKLEDHPMTLARDAFPGGFVMGANLAMTADVPAIVGAFDPRFGAGAPFRAAEDTDFLFRAQGRGVPVTYDPGFVVDHHHGRRGGAAARALLAGYGHGDGALYAKHLMRDARVLRIVLRDLAALRMDVVRPVRIEGVGAFHRFTARHKLAGFAAYAMRALRSRGAVRHELAEAARPAREAGVAVGGLDDVPAT